MTRHYITESGFVDPHDYLDLDPAGSAGIFGNGDDGDAQDVAASLRTLDRVYLYRNWTIEDAAVITPGRFPVFVQDTLLLRGGWIREAGGNGTGQVTGGAGGGAGAAGYLGVGSSGGNGGGGGGGGANGAASAQQPRSIGVKGAGGSGGLSGGGGAAGAGGALTLAIATNGAPYVAYPQLGFFTNTFGVSPMNGGSGGGGGGGGAATGGKGGGGGGVIVIFARNIVIVPGATQAGGIQAYGGDGAPGQAGNGGGGGGGGGGKILIVTRSYDGPIPNVDGGKGGAGQGTGNPGADGNAGQYVLLPM